MLKSEIAERNHLRGRIDEPEDRGGDFRFSWRAI
jgi:hypothetical protein